MHLEQLDVLRRPTWGWAKKALQWRAYVYKWDMAARRHCGAYGLEHGMTALFNLVKSVCVLMWLTLVGQSYVEPLTKETSPRCLHSCLLRFSCKWFSCKHGEHFSLKSSGIALLILAGFLFPTLSIAFLWAGSCSNTKIISVEAKVVASTVTSVLLPGMFRVSKWRKQRVLFLSFIMVRGLFRTCFVVFG